MDGWGAPMRMKMNAVGASGRSPVSDLRLPSSGDRPVAPTTSAIFEAAAAFPIQIKTLLHLMTILSLDILVFVHIPKEKIQMNSRKALGLMVCVLLAVSCFAQGSRGKAELKAGAGSITIDYGQPALKGRDMLSQLQVGQFWRMGNNLATVLTSPVDLTFGSTKVPKGSYSLWLKRTNADTFELVFNTQTGQWGTQHDPSKDAFQVPMKKETLPNSVEVFTINLKGAPKGGIFTMDWGTTQLSTEIQFAQ
jgi:hypothetical protein